MVKYDKDIYPGIVIASDDTDIQVKCMHSGGQNKFGPFMTMYSASSQPHYQSLVAMWQSKEIYGWILQSKFCVCVCVFCTCVCAYMCWGAANTTFQIVGSSWLIGWWYGSNACGGQLCFYNAVKLRFYKIQICEVFWRMCAIVRAQASGHLLLFLFTYSFLFCQQLSSVYNNLHSKF